MEYRIHLHGPNGSLHETRVVDFDRDDDAIDHAGRIDHPEPIQVWQGDRLVAQFPARREPPLFRRP